MTRPESVSRTGWMHSASVKVAALGVLTLALTVPALLIFLLVKEREQRRLEVTTDVARTWGGSQAVSGPMLLLEFERQTQPAAGESPASPVKADRWTRRLVLPRSLSWSGEVDPAVRSRSLFDVVVYRANLRAEGSFDLASLRSPGESGLELRRVRVVVGLSDVRGLETKPAGVLDTRPLQFEDVEQLPGLGAVLAARVDLTAFAASEVAEEPGAESSAPSFVDFAVELPFRGTEGLTFLPAGDDTLVSLRSAWNSPGFRGAYLPGDWEVGDDGLLASWQVPHFGRGYSSFLEPTADLWTLFGSSRFGVDFVEPTDEYQQTERSIKYAVLFVVLTFTTLLVLEIRSGVRLHPIHYLLVGSALCVFYVLLLSLSEHLGFAPAYGLASAAVVGLVSGYVRSVLRAGSLSATLASVLTGLYGYLFVLLRLESLALLVGAVGLFTALATLMFLTRHLDWFEMRFRDLEPKSSSTTLG